MYALLGKSGSGKTTLLHILSGYDDFDSGEIKVQGRVISIFQNYELIDALNVYENIFLGKHAESEDFVLLEKMQITKLLKQYPQELSGGQKQRVCIARAMVAKADILCCDEPTAALDLENKKVVLEILKSYAENHIVIITTHDVDEAMEYANGIYRIVDKHLQYKNISHSLKSKCLLERFTECNSQQLKRILRKINHTTSCLFCAIFISLLIILQLLCIVKNTLFTISDTSYALDANMVCIETKNQEVVQKALPYLTVHSIYVNEKEYMVGAYPYINNPNELKITGNKPRGINILVNQNVVHEVLGSEWKNQEIVVCLQVNPYIYRVNVRVIGVVEEKDTEELHVYYNLDGWKEYMHSKILSDGKSLEQLFDETLIQFVKSVPYAKVQTTLDRLNQNPNIDAYSPFLEEKHKRKEEVQLYKYVCMGCIGSVVLLTIIFILVFTQKEIAYQSRGYAVMIANGVDAKVIKKTYLKTKETGIILFCFVDGIVLFLLEKIIPFSFVYVFGYVIGLVAFSVCISLWMFQFGMKKHVAMMLKSEV